MKVVLHGKEIKCHSWTDVKAGEVVLISECVYLKAQTGHVVRLDNGVTEAYNGQQFRHFPDAELILDPKAE